MGAALLLPPDTLAHESSTASREAQLSGEGGEVDLDLTGLLRPPDASEPGPGGRSGKLRFMVHAGK